ncbi:MAG: hypothetical protein C4288_00960 [Leptolyngbya sp. ERB_1_1]
MNDNDNQQTSESQSSNDAHPLATGLGAMSGGVIGAALGRSIDKTIGTAVGGVVGAIAGGMAANAVTEMTETVIDQVQPSGLGFGADNQPVELPRHYTWDELQALSKPQGGK